MVGQCASPWSTKPFEYQRRWNFVALNGALIRPSVERFSSDLSKTVPDAIKRIDHVEGIVDRQELSTHSLDVAVDRAVIDVDVIVISRIHERVAALDHARASRERLQDQELGDRQHDRLAHPRAGMSFGMDPQPN